MTPTPPASRDTIESLGRELDAAERAAHGHNTSPLWGDLIPLVHREFSEHELPDYAKPFESRIRALLDAPRKPRATRAELRVEVRRLKRRVNRLVRGRRDDRHDYDVQREELEHVSTTLAEVRDILDADACETVAQAALRVVNGRLAECERLRRVHAVDMRNCAADLARANAAFDDALAERDAARAAFASTDAIRASLVTENAGLRAERDAAMGVVEAFRQVWPHYPHDNVPLRRAFRALAAFDATRARAETVDTAESLGAELRAIDRGADPLGEDWLRAAVRRDWEPSSILARRGDIPDPLKLRVRAWITAERAKAAKPVDTLESLAVEWAILCNSSVDTEFAWLMRWVSGDCSTWDARSISARDSQELRDRTIAWIESERAKGHRDTKPENVPAKVLAVASVPVAHTPEEQARVIAQTMDDVCAGGDPQRALDKAVASVRRPPPLSPEVLANANPDPIRSEVGAARAAKSVRVVSRDTKPGVTNPCPRCMGSGLRSPMRDSGPCVECEGTGKKTGAWTAEHEVWACHCSYEPNWRDAGTERCARCGADRPRRIAATPEHVGTWTEEMVRGKPQWRCGCDDGNLRVHGAERCSGCGWGRPNGKVE